MNLESARRIAAQHDPESWRQEFPILASTNYLVTHSMRAPCLFIPSHTYITDGKFWSV